eukprot:NODE_595_length_1275_cov_266.085644_g430_i0.p1 GENE.NODE_595_length_1275_cov_266.085644_g430_i0~~NODE_595_length_1275_cov_266.085644_g430_i0.p1  ORF type:complete len:304 (-),score=135.97 NODE_595_length_1275_cov_266.085644_g430_i0:362-1222(-)
MGACCSGPSQPKSQSDIVTWVSRAKFEDKQKQDILKDDLTNKYGKGADFAKVSTDDELKEFFDLIAVDEKWETKEKNKIKDKIWPDGMRALMMDLTKIPSFDEIFAKAAAPINTTTELRDTFDEARLKMKSTYKTFTDETGACPKDLTTAMTLLKKAAGTQKFEIKFVLEPPEFEINADGATGAVADGIVALVGLKTAVIDILTRAPPVQEDMEALIEEAKPLPAKAKEAASEANLSLGESLTAAKNTSSNQSKLTGILTTLTDLRAQGKTAFDELKRIADILAAQ